MIKDSDIVQNVQRQEDISGMLLEIMTGKRIIQKIIKGVILSGTKKGIGEWRFNMCYSGTCPHEGSHSGECRLGSKTMKELCPMHEWYCPKCDYENINQDETCHECGEEKP